MKHLALCYLSRLHGTPSATCSLPPQLPPLTCQCMLLFPSFLCDLLFWQEQELPFSTYCSSCPLTSCAAGIPALPPHQSGQLLEDMEMGGLHSCQNRRPCNGEGSNSACWQVSGGARKRGETNRWRLWCHTNDLDDMAPSVSCPSLVNNLLWVKYQINLFLQNNISDSVFLFRNNPNWVH